MLYLPCSPWYGSHCFARVFLIEEIGDILSVYERMERIYIGFL